MKQDLDKEIDFLLRRHARREARPAPDGLRADEGAGFVPPHEMNAGRAHLDADEMNAYAEGALPPATRSRYAAHLTDCDSCRKIVTDLALAANVATKGEKLTATEGAAAAPSASWRGWIAALFAPPVLRYAVPALALLAVMIVALVGLRQDRRPSSLVARDEKERVPSGAPAEATGKQAELFEQVARSSSSDDAGVANTASSPTITGMTQPAAKVAPSSPAKEKESQASADTDTVTPPAPRPAAPAAVAKDEAEQRASDQRADENAFMARNAPAPPAQMSAPAERDRASEKKDAAKAREPEPGVSANQANAPQGSATVENAEVTARRELPVSGRSSSSGSKMGALKSAPRAKRRSEGAEESVTGDQDSAETRSAGGRRFRRQAGAWVDTAYNPTSATINVRRGSEQYRALVADEPGIRRIAEQLGGELIIVWKGTAYRIY